MPLALSGHKERVWCCKWNKATNALATCSQDGKIFIWGPRLGKWVQLSFFDKVHLRTIRSVCWSPEGNYIATGSFDATISVIAKSEETTKYKVVATLEGHENEVKCVDWHNNGDIMASCSRDRMVWVWGVDEGMEMECLAILNGHKQDVKCVKWHPVERVLFSSSYDDTIKIWMCDDDEDGEWYCHDTLEGHKSTVWSLAIHNSGKTLFSCGEDMLIMIWKEKDDRKWVLNQIIENAHTRPIYSICFCPKTGWLATASGDNSIKFYRNDSKNGENIDKDNFKEFFALKDAHTGDVNCVDFCETTEGDIVVATASDDTLVKIWQFDKKNDKFF